MSRNSISRKRVRKALEEFYMATDLETYKLLEKGHHEYTWDELVDTFVRGYGLQ